MRYNAHQNRILQLLYFKMIMVAYLPCAKIFTSIILLNVRCIKKYFPHWVMQQIVSVIYFWKLRQFLVFHQVLHSIRLLHFVPFGKINKSNNYLKSLCNNLQCLRKQILLKETFVESLKIQFFKVTAHRTLWIKKWEKNRIIMVFPLNRARWLYVL